MIELDFIAQRYHKLPSELIKLDISDFQFDLLVASESLLSESKKIKKRQADKQWPKKAKQHYS